VPTPRRILAVGGCLAVCLTGVPLQAVQADSTDLPPTLQAIVDGDVTEYQWMLDAVNAEQAWTDSTGAGTVVAVIDTGVDATHPDLDTQVIDGARVTEDANGKKILVPATVAQTSGDFFGHGSHVSGIVAADDDGNGVTGIAPDAQIMPIALLTRKGVETDLDWLRMITAGIKYASDNSADVINMSLGLQSSGIIESPRTEKYLANVDKLCAAVDAASTAGTVVVAAAGNDGAFGNPALIPGACPTSLTVAALAPSFNRTDWSSFDASVDLAAPGLEVLSVDSTVANLSPTPHVLESGTSMASPVVAGVAALLRSAHPGWTADQIIDELKTTAQDIDVPGKDPDTGHGIVDAAAALGVAAPLAEPSDFFSTWAQRLVGDDSTGVATVGWTTPDAHAITGYTVTVHTATGTTDYAVAGDTVRKDVALSRGEGWTVTAHTTAGDVTTYPSIYQAGSGIHGDRPERLRHIKLERDGDSVIISWDRPENRDSIDVINAYVSAERAAHARARIKVDQDEPFPRQMRVRLPAKARWYDVRAGLELINTDDDGNFTGWDYVMIDDTSAAIHGSRVEQVLAAGRNAVEAAGGVSKLNAKRVCGNQTCVGESATLVIDRGREAQRFKVRYNAAGDFHVTISVPRGSDSVKLRIVGPLRLDSGTFQRIKVQR